MPFARVQDAALHYQLLRCDTRRDAETVVMIHGLAASMAFWYFQLAPQIAKNYNVLVYDLKGHGGSRMVPGGYSAEAMADDLVLLLDALDVTRAHIIAHSFGGSIALHFVLRFPQRVASLTLADSQLSSVRQLASNWTQGEKVQSLVKRCGIELDTADPFFGYRLLKELARQRVRGAVEPGVLRELAPNIQGRAGIKAARQWLALLDSTSAESELFRPDGLTDGRLRQVQCPVLALYGELSQALNSGRHIAKLIPGIDFRIVSKAGHFFPISRPRNLLNAWSGFSSKLQEPVSLQ